MFPFCFLRLVHILLPTDTQWWFVQGLTLSILGDHSPKKMVDVVHARRLLVFIYETGALNTIQHSFWQLSSCVMIIPRHCDHCSDSTLKFFTHWQHGQCFSCHSVPGQMTEKGSSYHCLSKCILMLSLTHQTQNESSRRARSFLLSSHQALLKSKQGKI